ncbi:MAG: 16S rRNA (cytidine(1402)-2'-O)-methyltransferase [Bacteroidales bacterium]|nr:16S rRNA (cytidine(1402)-2'-O)-methyltransferase [Bacteroidales bacterium]
MSKLYIVPTPIGNLEDITMRALTVLREADCILAEDTRTSGHLLYHFGISKPMQAFHKFNEHKVLDSVVARIARGETMAMVSDAGTPSISDPGFLIVRACVAAGIPVECLPGATAFVPALVDSGFPTDRFCFEGFLPQKKGRRKRLAALQQEPRTMVFYESPFRLEKALEEMSEVFGPDRLVSVSREISKVHEETVRGSFDEVRQIFRARGGVKGECVVVVEGLDGFLRRTSGRTEDEGDGTDMSSEM